ncbi:MAG TPA: UDP-N-acetylmuramoyl-tripeptide--D-alanyl-D-alanine ligase [Clostridia bacterium]|nr:UDP-N-acetylmuramoyl-tripeptide--D-alanyl-D-alanine ligase [Clostridia bacterium]
MALAEIARAVGARTSINPMITDICTDTRKLSPGCLFIAIAGPNFDGHSFAKTAIEQGAAAVLCERETDCGEGELLVSDTRAALLQLAGYYRSLFDAKVIGITGSVGKTTTKEMTAAVLAGTFNVLKNAGNLNNEIGLPMTVFELDESVEVAVLEMGMSDLGEISRLSGVCKPDIGVITNIGVSHIENLGSQENILKAKMEIMDGMRDDAPLLLNADDPFLVEAQIGEHPVFYYGIENEACDFRACNIEQNESSVCFTIVSKGGEQEVYLPAIGKHNVYNALASFAAGVLVGVSPQRAASALAAYVPAGMRQRIKHLVGITFIEDCYNASPDSVRAALEVLAGLNATNRIAVLGDMLELGDHAEQAHMEVGDQLGANKVDVLLTLGRLSKWTAQKAKEVGVGMVQAFDDKKELARALCSMLSPGDAVLFKASRSMGFEDIIEMVYRELKVDE